MKFSDTVNELQHLEYTINAINQNLWLLSDAKQMLLDEKDIQLILALMAKNLQDELEKLEELIGHLSDIGSRL